MARILDVTGKSQQVEPSLEWYKEASDAGLSLPQWINSKFETDATKYGNAYHQILASEGIILKPNREFGLRSNTIQEMTSMQASGVVKDSGLSSAALRTLFPSAILTAVEDKLVEDLNMNADVFDKLVAFDDVIQGDKFERPLINYDNPTGARSQAISQLAEPKIMLSITASEYSRSIPTLSLGMLISDQAKKGTTLDLVALALARQVATERMLRSREYFLTMLLGDPDLGTKGPGIATVASLVVAKYGATKDTMVGIDAAATAGITQLGWMRWLYRNSTTRVIDWVVTDIEGAIALENRSGRPTNNNDNPNSPRIDSTIAVGNPTWKSNVNVFITDDPNWPAKTVLGFDSRYAIGRTSSATIAYSAIENFVLRRAEAIRLDFGEIAYRMYDDAFDLFTYA
jgi:hypothetical protein